MPKVLLVDDEANVLRGFRRTLHGRYDCVMAQGAAEAMAELCQEPDLAVIVTDMRMPGMDGITFITQARRLRPDAVYLMLTGNADLDTAADAVNRGHVFRFLRKPCPPEVFHPALDAALKQHATATAEQVLLRRTLTGSVGLLTEMLGLARPGLAEHHGRVRRAARQLVTQLELPDPWAHEVAALLSQIGRFSLPPELTEASAESLEDPDDRALLRSHPQRAARMLRHIPRLDLPGRIVARQLDATEPPTDPADAAGPDLEAWGGSVLRVALAFDALFDRCGSEAATRRAVRDKLADPCPRTCAALVEMPTTECENSDAPLRSLGIDRLRPGMFTAAAVRLCDGQPLLGRGRELTEPLIAQLQTHADRGLLHDPIDVLVPDDTDPEPDHELDGDLQPPAAAA
ncbi:MAG: HD domain-containing phosphohydrolase [Planctomycetota bacterium]